MLRRFFSRNAERLFMFLAGVLISAVVSGLIDKMITWSVGLLVSTVVVLSIATVFLIASASQRIHDIANQMEATVKYIEEPYRKEQGIPYQGHIFNEIARLASEAENEILLLGTPFSNVIHDTSLDPSRERYLQAIEENINRHKDTVFTYIRIQQMPWEEQDSAHYKDYSQMTIDHCIKALQLKEKVDSSDLAIHIMKIKSQRLSSFVIIDKRWLVLEIDGYDPRGLTYMIGAFFLEDRSGKLIERFARYFRSIERQAEDLSLKDFEQTEVQATGALQSDGPQPQVAAKQ